MIALNRETMEFTGLDAKVMEQLRKTFPLLDIEHELNKMKLWLLSGKGRLRKGNLQFIVGWLGRVKKPNVEVTETGTLKALQNELNTIVGDKEWLHTLNSLR